MSPNIECNIMALGGNTSMNKVMKCKQYIIIVDRIGKNVNVIQVIYSAQKNNPFIVHVGDVHR